MASHTCPTHLIRSKALHVTGLDSGTDITWAATITEGSRERHGVFPGRLHAAVHSCAGWFKASLIRSCLKALATSKISAPTHSNDTNSQKLWRALKGLCWPPRAGHAARTKPFLKVKPSHVCKRQFGDCLRNSAVKESLQGWRHTYM